MRISFIYCIKFKSWVRLKSIKVICSYLFWCMRSDVVLERRRLLKSCSGDEQSRIRKSISNRTAGERSLPLLQIWQTCGRRLLWRLRWSIRWDRWPNVLAQIKHLCDLFFSERCWSLTWLVSSLSSLNFTVHDEHRNSLSFSWSFMCAASASPSVNCLAQTTHSICSSPLIFIVVLLLWIISCLISDESVSDCWQVIGAVSSTWILRCCVISFNGELLSASNVTVLVSWAALVSLGRFPSWPTSSVTTAAISSMMISPSSSVASSRRSCVSLSRHFSFSWWTLWTICRHSEQILSGKITTSLQSSL